MAGGEWKNKLFFGDNLDILREHIPDESVDLIYLDPPFNSKATYNVLFAEKDGTQSRAQITAFEDTWHWGMESEAAFHELVTEGPGKIPELVNALRSFLGQNDMMAYLVMMAQRLVELHRALKPTGSIYLHCDPTASHYLKLVMDAVFGPSVFQNELVWKRFNFHADARRYGRVSDRLLFYTKTSEYTFNSQSAPFSEEYVRDKFRYDDHDGRGLYCLDNLNPPGGRGPVYEFHGVTKPWRYAESKMRALEADGRIYTRSKVPRVKRYLKSSLSKPLVTRSPSPRSSASVHSQCS